jgi:hypothetical protein
VALTALAWSCAQPARAQEASPAPSPEPAASPAAAAAPGIDVTGFVDTYYGYNFNGVDPLLRTYDVQHNTLSLNLAEVAFAKGVTTDSRVGFRVDLDFGKAADLTAAYEPEENGQEIYKHIQQAYLSVLAGDKVTFDVGKFVTPHGAEVIESQDNWNYTRSILFGFAIPFYHCGVRATAPVSDKVTLTGYLVNGWNNCSEVNDGKTLGFGATLKPGSKVTWVGTFMFGPELPDVPGEDEDSRLLFDTTLTLALTPKFSLMVNGDYGKEGDTTWWGLAGYAKLQARDNWALVGRVEYLDDTDGGFMTIGQKAQSFTLTSDHTIAGGLRARLEYRLDKTDEGFFLDDEGDLVDDQSTLTVGLVYVFGGKI